MTCIVGRAESTVTPGRVWIGGDSLGSAMTENYHLGQRRADPKVFVFEDSMAIGFTTSYRMGQILRYHLKFEEPFTPPDGLRVSKDDATTWEEWTALTEKWLVVHFVNAVRQALKEGGWAKKEDEREEGGAFLIGYRGVLWRMDSDFQIGRSILGYDAVGSGMQFALGSLHALTMCGMTTSPEGMVDAALMAAAEFCPHVREPFKIVSVLA